VASSIGEKWGTGHGFGRNNFFSSMATGQPGSPVLRLAIDRLLWGEFQPEQMRRAGCRRQGLLFQAREKWHYRGDTGSSDQCVRKNANTAPRALSEHGGV